MPQLSLASVRKQLISSDSGLLFIMAGAVAGLIVLGLVIIYLQLNKTPPKLPTAADAPKLHDLTYLTEQKAVTTFVWQPLKQSPQNVTGTLQTGLQIPTGSANPGTALVNEGYRQIELDQSQLEPYERKTGFQKDQQVCVVTARMSNGADDMWVDNPSYDYDLNCGILSQ